MKLMRKKFSNLWEIISVLVQLLKKTTRNQFMTLLVPVRKNVFDASILACGPFYASMGLSILAFLSIQKSFVLPTATREEKSVLYLYCNPNYLPEWHFADTFCNKSGNQRTVRAAPLSPLRPTTTNFHWISAQSTVNIRDISPPLFFGE